MTGRHRLEPDIGQLDEEFETPCGATVIGPDGAYEHEGECGECRANAEP